MALLDRYVKVEIFLPWSDPYADQKIIQSGAIEHLVRKTHSVDDEIRLNALWAIKNSLFNAKQTEKSKIMEVLTWDHYAEYVFSLVPVPLN